MEILCTVPKERVGGIASERIKCSKVDSEDAKKKKTVEQHIWRMLIGMTN